MNEARRNSLKLLAALAAAGVVPQAWAQWNQSAFEMKSIGDAMREARPDLYRSGVFRKYLLVVTDGDNTNGRSPDDVAREIFRKSEGAVQIYFVAFDTSPEKFAFLKEAGGDVIGAGTGAELKTALDGIYQGKILAEAPGGEREPVKK